MSNKAAFVETAKGQIVVRDAEIAQPGDGEVLVKVPLQPRKHVIPVDPESGTRMCYSACRFKSCQTCYDTRRVSCRPGQPRGRRC